MYSAASPADDPLRAARQQPVCGIYKNARQHCPRLLGWLGVGDHLILPGVMRPTVTARKQGVGGESAMLQSLNNEVIHVTHR